MDFLFLFFLVFKRSLVTSEFAAATVLITYGAVLGKVSRLQLLVIGVLEVVFYAINELIAVEFLKYADAGGSIIIHTFGAYFGLALSRVLHSKKALDSPKEESVYHSDLFAMIGKFSLFSSELHLFFSFNFTGTVVQRATLITTYLIRKALNFWFSSLASTRPHKKEAKVEKEKIK